MIHIFLIFGFSAFSAVAYANPLLCDLFEHRYQPGQRVRVFDISKKLWDPAYVTQVEGSRVRGATDQGRAWTHRNGSVDLDPRPPDQFTEFLLHPSVYFPHIYEGHILRLPDGRKVKVERIDVVHQLFEAKELLPANFASLSSAEKDRLLSASMVVSFFAQTEYVGAADDVPLYYEFNQTSRERLSLRR